MQNLNAVTLAGNLSNDCEMRYTPKGIAVANFSVAVNDSYTKDGTEHEITTFVDCTAFAGMAEKAGDYKKGQAVYVVGKLRKDSWDDKATGQKRYKMYVQVDAVTSAFVGGPKSTGKAPPNVSREKKTDYQVPLPVDDDVPF